MLRVFGCMVASWVGYRMARGWHYAKLSLSSAPPLSFSGMLCILLFLFLSLGRFLCVCVFFCSHWSLVDVPLIFFCPADHVPDWQPRIVLGMVEARSVNVKKTTRVRNVVDATRFLGAWLRAGEGIGWLAAGTMPNSLYRMPLVYLFLACVFCYSCSFLLVVFCVFVFIFCSHWSLVEMFL